MSIVIEFILRNWKAFAIVGVFLALFAAWEWDRHGQYTKGVSDAKVEIQKQINRSTELVGTERAAALDAATRAARQLCIDAGADPSACEGL